MRYKYSVALLLFAAVLGMVLLSAPATAAKTGDTVTIAGPGGYYIKIVKSQPAIMRPMTVFNTIHQGEYQWQSKNVNYFTTQVQFDLNWGNPGNSLRLRIITPDGYVLGPYLDLNDGSVNGDIFVTICRDSGVAQGTWYTEVYGNSVSGSQSYYI